MNIYISGLSYNINDDDLNELFTEYGEVSSARVINDRETGKSRGFGFVEMPNDTDAQKAIDELNGAEYDNKVISVSIARPKTERPSFGGNRNRGNNSGFRRNNGFGRDNGGFGKR
ncbi:MAG: RNA-binding protein [Tannerella sp.]|jgi:RNA recognition motif-containing protein|nr:RNA-binding protein [Tannerella sp.]